MKTDDYLGIDAISAYLETQKTEALADGDRYRAAEFDEVLGMIVGSIEYFAWCEQNAVPPPTRREHRAQLHRKLAEYICQYDIPLPAELHLDMDYHYGWWSEPDGDLSTTAPGTTVVLPECQEWSAAGTRKPSGVDADALDELLSGAAQGALEKVVDGVCATGHYLMQCGCCDRETAVPRAAYDDWAISSWPCPSCQPAGGVDLIHARRHAD